MKKHKLLREDILPAMASNRKVQRLLNEFMDLLSEYGSAETNQDSKHHPNQPKTALPAADQMDLAPPTAEQMDSNPQATDQVDLNKLALVKVDSSAAATDKGKSDSSTTDQKAPVLPAEEAAGS